MNPSSDHNLSDHAHFKAVFDEYYESVRKFIYYKSGKIDLAEDLAQEAFFILWKKRDKIDPTKVKAYLFTIANNLFLNEVKHEKVVLRFQQRPINGTSVETPQYLMEEEEFKQKLEKAISELPEKNRLVFLMNRIEKLTYREIAERLDITVKAVEKRMHKALIELREIWPKI